MIQSQANETTCWLHSPCISLPPDRLPWLSRVFGHFSGGQKDAANLRRKEWVQGAKPFGVCCWVMMLAHTVISAVFVTSCRLHKAVDMPLLLMCQLVLQWQLEIERWHNIVGCDLRLTFWTCLPSQLAETHGLMYGINSQHKLIFAPIDCGLICLLVGGKLSGCWTQLWCMTRQSGWSDLFVRETRSAPLIWLWVSTL